MSLPRVHWRRSIYPQLPTTLPVGFLKHRGILSTELLECLEDILELQFTVGSMRKSTFDRLHLSNMQASIESRLAFEKRACRNHVAECCRIAALMTCFLSFTKTWANALVPCRLSDQLRKLLHSSMESPIWSRRRDLQIWLLLVGSSICITETAHVDDLQRKWRLLLDRFRLHSMVRIHEKPERSDLEGALSDFIYCESWMLQRNQVPGWSELELAFEVD